MPTASADVNPRTRKSRCRPTNSGRFVVFKKATRPVLNTCAKMRAENRAHDCQQQDFPPAADGSRERVSSDRESYRHLALTDTRPSEQQLARFAHAISSTRPVIRHQKPQRPLILPAKT